MPRRSAPPGTDRRQQILDAALDVFADEGFDAASTKVIAEKADVTQGLIYFYFPSKEELFDAAFQQQAEQVTARLAVYDERARAEPPAAFLRRFTTQLIAVMEEPHSVKLLRIMSQMHMSDKASDSSCPHRVTPFKTLGTTILATIREFIADQCERGALRPIDVTAASELVGMALLVTLLRRTRGDAPLARISAETLTETIVTTLLFGLLPQKAPERRKLLEKGRFLSDEVG